MMKIYFLVPRFFSLIGRSAIWLQDISILYALHMSEFGCSISLCTDYKLSDQSRPVSPCRLQYIKPSMPDKKIKSVFPLLHVHCKALPIFFHSLSSSRARICDSIGSMLCERHPLPSPKRSFPLSNSLRFSDLVHWSLNVVSLSFRFATING